ncbi:GMC oxidoreductase [Ohtaekwangia koreensis]|uniref:Choline dehydrogenase n=1 Tax=Ohtaekwangia koreensis TaxID=688867 RepID=A0A1T5LMQ3_9BACT|nr:GMC family oxidoreductase [Ohtaekwangia koreensis]SKC77135.1 Choline dehydrogenase [Ohtaekwangia koreensis]
MNLNIEAQKQNTYDAIVVGTGISGGWAAKELTQKGLKTLVLERGRDVKHQVDYPTMTKDPWQLPHANKLTEEQLKFYPVQSRTNWVNQANKHWWVNDFENPYTEVKPFDWIRGYHAGGRSIMWGKQTYRLSDLDFDANAKEGIGVDWPIRYKDLAPWYDHVESYIGVSGQMEGIPHLPDGKFLPPMELNCVEEVFRDKLSEKFNGRKVTIGRVAHLTAALPHDPSRGVCQSRNMCDRGCPYGAYFSSNASTLPAAIKTGNMTLRPHSIVHSVIYDEKKGKAIGVRVLDANTKEEIEFYAKIIFLNASTLGSTFILLNSTSPNHPNGLGNSSGQLGHNLMDHQYRTGAEADVEGFDDKYYVGRRPNGIYIPRFRNIGNDKRTDFLRGFGYQGGASRESWARGVAEMSFGADLKSALENPGPWKIGITGFGECLPYHENKVSINKDKKDIYGLPTLNIDAEWKENEKAMRKDMKASAAEMLEASGFKNVRTYDVADNMGLGIHEMGTARMGKDPKTSVLNKWNQVHDAPNVFVTDGAAMTSSACQNPSLTYMALTARAADYAVSELKKRNL